MNRLRVWLAWKLHALEGRLWMPSYGMAWYVRVIHWVKFRVAPFPGPTWSFVVGLNRWNDD